MVMVVGSISDMDSIGNSLGCCCNLFWDSDNPKEVIPAGRQEQ